MSDHNDERQRFTAISVTFDDGERVEVLDLTPTEIKFIGDAMYVGLDDSAAAGLDISEDRWQQLVLFADEVGRHHLKVAQGKDA